jgi:hypothetical protein
MAVLVAIALNIRTTAASIHIGVDRPVVAKTTIPPAAFRFAARQKVVAEHPGWPFRSG